MTPKGLSRKVDTRSVIPAKAGILNYAVIPANAGIQSVTLGCIVALHGAQAFTTIISFSSFRGRPSNPPRISHLSNPAQRSSSSISFL